jgi:hypothetical protein
MHDLHSQHAEQHRIEEHPSSLVGLVQQERKLDVPHQFRSEGRPEHRLKGAPSDVFQGRHAGRLLDVLASRGVK